MALIITLRHDGGLTLESDDQQAENARVEDAFAGTSDEGDFIENDEDDDPDFYEDPAVDFDVLEAWRNAPFEDGKLTVEFKPEHSKDIIEALEAAGFMIDEEIVAATFPHVGGGPKPKKN